MTCDSCRLCLETPVADVLSQDTTGGALPGGHYRGALPGGHYRGGTTGGHYRGDYRGHYRGRTTGGAPSEMGPRPAVAVASWNGSTPTLLTSSGGRLKKGTAPAH